MRRRTLLAGLAASAVAAPAASQSWRPGFAPGFRHGFQFLGAGDDPDVSAYIAALTTPPSGAERARLNTLVRGLKADGVWALLDRLNVLAAESQQAGLRDLRNPAKALTASGTITFTADRGFLGDGSTGYLDYGEAFAFSGAQFSLNSAALGVWCNAEGAGGVKTHVGNVANSPRSTITPRTTAGAETFLANDATGDTLMASNGSRLGHRTLSRTAALVKRGFFAGSRTADLTTAATAVNTANGSLLRSGAGYADDRLAAAYSGGGLTDAQVASLHGRLSTYLSGKGAA